MFIGAVLPTGRTRSAHLPPACYFVSHPLRVSFRASCFDCFAARFSLSVRLGFFGWLDGVDFEAITSG